MVELQPGPVMQFTRHLTLHRCGGLRIIIIMIVSNEHTFGVLLYIKKLKKTSAQKTC